MCMCPMKYIGLNKQNYLFMKGLKAHFGRFIFMSLKEIIHISFGFICNENFGHVLACLFRGKKN